LSEIKLNQEVKFKRFLRTDYTIGKVQTIAKIEADNNEKLINKKLYFIEYNERCYPEILTREQIEPLEG
jgi:hypothetical protein